MPTTSAASEAFRPSRVRVASSAYVPGASVIMLCPPQPSETGGAFHAATSYDILRMLGVKIGKTDFLGRLRMRR